MKNGTKLTRVICVGMTICLMVSGLTACGSESSTDSQTSVMGRITAKSDQEITIAVFDNAGGNGPKGASGGAIDGKGKPGDPNGNNAGGRPDLASGGAVGGMDKPEGTPPADMPEGTPPANMPENKDSSNQKQMDQQKPQSTESKTIKIDGSTKFYTQQGDDKTEVSMEEVSLGSMVSVTLDGDTAESITIQTMMNRGQKQQNGAQGNKNGSKNFNNKGN